MPVLLSKICELSLLAQRSNAYERGRAVGRMLGIIFVIVIVVAVYKRITR